MILHSKALSVCFLAFIYIIFIKLINYMDIQPNYEILILSSH